MGPKGPQESSRENNSDQREHGTGGTTGVKEQGDRQESSDRREPSENHQEQERRARSGH